jgi:hypothetical protein
MRARTLLVAALLAATAAGAQASATFNLALRGSGTFYQENGPPYGCSPTPDDPCFRVVDWIGAFSIETVSGADGTYTAGFYDDNGVWSGTQILSMSLAANFLSFSLDDIQPSVSMPYGESVTIAGGKVTAIEVTWYPSGIPYPDVFGITGLDAFYSAFGYHQSQADLHGVLTNVPEPSGALTALLGLAALCCSRWRRLPLAPRPDGLSQLPRSVRGHTTLHAQRAS